MATVQPAKSVRLLGDGSGRVLCGWCNSDVAILGADGLRLLPMYSCVGRHDPEPRYSVANRARKRNTRNGRLDRSYPNLDRPNVYVVPLSDPAPYPLECHQCGGFNSLLLSDQE